MEEGYVLPLWVLGIKVGSSGLCSKQLYPMVVPRSIFKKIFFSFVHAATQKLQTVLKTAKAAALDRHTQADPGWSASPTEHRLALSCPRSSHQRRMRDEEVSKKGSKNSSWAIRRVDVGSSSP